MANKAIFSGFFKAILFGNNSPNTKVKNDKIKVTTTKEIVSPYGIFKFNKDYEMTAFTTNDRAVSNTDGTMEYIPWSALCTEYKLSTDGILQPTKFQAVWNYPDNDFIYFDGTISKISYEK